MIYAIISDIHANIEALDAVLNKCNELKVERYICLGDIVGYNASPSESIEKVRALDFVNIIKGNHDEYIGRDFPIEGINRLAREAVLWTRTALKKSDRKWLIDLPLKLVNIKEGFSAVHATLDSPESWRYILDVHHSIDSFSYQMTQLCFLGHTHLPRVFVKGNETSGTQYEVKRMEEWEQFPPDDGEVAFKLEKGKKYLVNVGSIGQPRDGDNRASFVVYDPRHKLVKRYAVYYDVDLTRSKILEAGLPVQLAHRLSHGW